MLLFFLALHVKPSFLKVFSSKILDFISHYDKFIKPSGNDAFKSAVECAVKVTIVSIVVNVNTL